MSTTPRAEDRPGNDAENRVEGRVAKRAESRAGNHADRKAENRRVSLDRIGEFSCGAGAAIGAPAPGHAIVRVRRVGLCGTDFHAFRGRQPFVTYPRILGHELGVEVMDVGPGADAGVGAGAGAGTDTGTGTNASVGAGAPAGRYASIAVGDRCAVEPYLNCGTCPPCRARRTNCCASLQVLGVHCDGGLQEWIELPLAKLHPSASLSFDELALVEPLSIGAHAVRRAQLTPGELVLVIGCGPIGYATMAAACAAGARVWAMDVSDDRLQFCAARLPLARATRIDGVADLENHEPPTAVFDATGNAASMTRAFEIVPSAGRLIFVGLVRENLTFNDPEFHRRELTVFASRNATAEDFRQVMTWIETSRLNASALVTHRVPFDHLIEEFPSLLEQGGKVFKTLVEFPDRG